MGTAKFLGRDRRCFHIGNSSRGLRESCTIADEEVRQIEDDEIYVVEKDDGKIEMLRGSVLVPQR